MPSGDAATIEYGGSGDWVDVMLNFRYQFENFVQIRSKKGSPSELPFYDLTSFANVTLLIKQAYFTLTHQPLGEKISGGSAL
jgi:hypothetical protein